MMASRLYALFANDYPMFGSQEDRVGKAWLSIHLPSL